MCFDDLHKRDSKSLAVHCKHHRSSSHQEAGRELRDRAEIVSSTFIIDQVRADGCAYKSQWASLSLDGQHA